MIEPDECAVELYVADGMQLDTKLLPVEPTTISSIRLPWLVGDKPGYPKEPIEFVLTTQ